MKNIAVWMLIAAGILSPALRAEDIPSSAGDLSLAPGGNPAAPVTATEPAPRTAEGSVPENRAEEPTPAVETSPEQNAEEKSAPVEEQPVVAEEKKPDTAAKEPLEPAKKEEKAEEKKEIVRPYFGVAIASGVFGLLAMASGFYFDYLAKKSFDQYQKMATPEAIRAAAQSPDFTPDEYVRKTRAKYDEGHQHIGSRNYAFIGGAVFIAAGIGLYFWTEEKKPEEEKRDEPISDKTVSVRTDGDRVTLNFGGSF